MRNHQLVIFVNCGEVLGGNTDIGPLVLCIQRLAAS
jgi:hypothetical protein